MKVKLCSWNVNGIRACVKKGFLEWMQKENNHILCLQETKAQPDQLEENLRQNKNYYMYYASAQKKGYSGVALFTKKSLGEPDVKIGLGVKKFDDEGRTIIAVYEQFILFCCYFPNGQRDHGRVPYKLAYSKEVAKRALEMEKEYGIPVIITGDYNTAHTEIDLKNPKTNKDTTGFLPIERKWMDKFISQGFHDVFREHHPGEEGHYTWWSYRSNCRERNIGWRIDYFFVTKGLLDNVKKTYHKPEVLGSDHCPIFLELKI